MAADANAGESTTLSPDEAFAVLGNETRLQILQTLGEADGPMAFSELYEHVEYADQSNFNYHLKRLAGHFVEATEEGYTLRRAGRRVIKAVLSGAVTEHPVIERTPVSTPCFLCGGDEMEVSYRQGVLGVYCRECGGTTDGSSPAMEWADESASDIVGSVGLSPAGVQDRTSADILRAGEIWSGRMAHASARGVCPDCSATIDQSLHVCEDHDPTGGRCEACERRFGVTVTSRCRNCIRDQRYTFSALLLAHTDVMAFMIEHGIDPLVPRGFHLSALEETILSVDPFEARFTFTVGDDALTLTVDDDLSVVDVTRSAASEAIR